MKNIIVNIIALFFVQFGNMLAPLLVIPSLSRSVSQSELGITLFSISFCSWITLFVEYGFVLSGSRDLAKNPSHIREIVSEIQVSKFYLCIVSGICSLILGLTFPIYHHNTEYLIVSVFLGLVIGLNPLWYFQGIQKAYQCASIDSLGMILWVICVLFLSDGMGGLGVLISLLIIKSIIYIGLGVYIIYYHGFVRNNVMSVMICLKKNFSLFFFRISISLYTNANVVILGYFVSPSVLGFYVAAERIAKTVNNMLLPVVNALYPKISSMLSFKKDETVLINRLTLVFMMTCSICGVMIIDTWGDVLVKWFLGHGFDSVYSLLRILMWTIPMIAISNVLGMQVIIPQGYEKNINFVIVITATVNIPLGILLAYFFGAEGMAWVVVFSETFVVIQMLYLIYRKRLMI